ncbi:FAD synthase [Chiloscyllium plagiosum]|uniref:FAD synthase n=1 Tax=Chiloscyllium plagiosum TaxID=36176 RepID=UPI001CB8214F|nr:FAD synthase [Chiloscyllium plagiosum]
MGAQEYGDRHTVRQWGIEQGRGQSSVTFDGEGTFGHIVRRTGGEETRKLLCGPMYCSPRILGSAFHVKRLSCQLLPMDTVRTDSNSCEEQTNPIVTAGIIIIGDEILKGQTQDTNSFFMCRTLRSLGVRVAKVSVVGDEVGAIAQEVSAFSARYRHVLTAGAVNVAVVVVVNFPVSLPPQGQTQDTNSFFMCRTLRSLGVRVAKVSVVGDEVGAIAQEVSAFSARYRHVLTAGGVGPTHDDRTCEGVARAFGEGLRAHPELAALAGGWAGAGKLARVPASARLHYGPGGGGRLPYPVVSVRNVYLFPGVPALLRRALQALAHLFRNAAVRYSTAEVLVDADEADIAPALERAQRLFAGPGCPAPRVSVGSYPDWTSNYFRVKVTLDAESEEAVREAKAVLLQTLPPGSVVAPETEPQAVSAREVYALARSGTSPARRFEYSL